MDSTGPVRNQSDLAEMVELLLEKGVVVNADIVVSIGDTELLGVELRAAIASFETAAKYGLEFPEGTDRDRVLEAAGEPSEEIPAEASEALPGGSGGDSGGQVNALRMRPAGPPGYAGDDEDDASTLDPAPYEPAREDRDPDVEDPGVEHPDVDAPDGDERATDDDEDSADAESDGAEGDEAGTQEAETDEEESGEEESSEDAESEEAAEDAENDESSEDAGGDEA